MSQTIDPREVLEYLNELGYTNITAQQLKDFIKDLKKLIKYDIRKKYTINSEDWEHEQTRTTTNAYEEHTYSSNYADKSNSSNIRNKHDERSSRSSSKSNKQKTSGLDSVTHLDDQQLLIVSTKEPTKREKQISVHIQKKHSSNNHEHCVHIPEPDTGIPNGLSTESNNMLKLKIVGKNSSDPSKVENTTESTIKSIRPNSTQTVNSKPSSSTSKKKMSKPSTAFIRPNSSKTISINKCDPVALYHYYQSQWKKVTIPGQDSRAGLRWSIREKMLGDPQHCSASCTHSCRKTHSSNRG